MILIIVYCISTANIFYSCFSFHSVTSNHTKRNGWNVDGTIESSMTKRNQIVLDVLIDCIIKTVLGWLRDVFRFISIAELFACLAKPPIGDLGEVNVEKSRTDNIQPVRID